MPVGMPYMPYIPEHEYRQIHEKLSVLEDRLLDHYNWLKKTPRGPTALELFVLWLCGWVAVWLIPGPDDTRYMAAQAVAYLLVWINWGRRK